MIVVIGGAGYVGSVLCRKLLHKGYDVTVVDPGFFGFEGLKDIEDKIKIIKKDAFLLTAGELMQARVKCVINLAGLSNDPSADFNPGLNFKLNTELTDFTAEVCKGAGVSKYIFASSCSIYDFGLDDEKKDILVDENTDVNPTRYYSLSKFKAERALLEHADENFKPIILRKATIYGYSPRMRYDLVVNTFVKDAFSKGALNLHKGGEIWRPLIDIDDVCEIYTRLIECDKTGIFNAVGTNIRISEVALRTMTAINNNIKLNCDYGMSQTGIRNYRVDGSKLHDELGFKPSTSIQDSVKKIVENINKINDFNNPIYYNIEWIKRYLQHWLKYD
jgi:nucleoside-diphosphate-sugar epimerase